MRALDLFCGGGGVSMGLHPGKEQIIINQRRPVWNMRRPPVRGTDGEKLRDEDAK